MATAASLVKRHGAEAPKWAVELAGGAVVVLEIPEGLTGAPTQ